MRSASEKIPTLDEAGELPAGAIANTGPDGDFDPVAILKALRGNFDAAGAAPASEAAPSEATGLSFDFSHLPRKRDSAFASRPAAAPTLSACLEDFTRTVAAPQVRRQKEQDKAAEAAEEACRAAIEATRAEEAKKAAEALAAAERAWAEDTAQALSAQLDEAFVELHNRLADAIASALTPVLEDAMRARAIDRFSASLERLFGKRGASEPITICGPETLLEAFRAVRGGDTAGLKLVASNDSELVASVNDTTLRTTIKAWASTLAAATGSRHG